LDIKNSLFLFLFFFQCYHHISSSYWSNISDLVDLEDKVHLKRVGVTYLGYVIRVL